MSRVVGKTPARVGLAAVLVAAAAGCGGSSGTPAAGGPDGPTADVITGVVRVGDKHLTHGTVSFHTAGGRVVKAFIVIDGSYQIRNAPPGPAKVVVVSGDPPKMPVAGGAPPADAPKMVKIDFAAKYGDVATTDLTYDIQPGRHMYDIVLTP
ncbi:MAG: hypothetical protein K2X87_17020 [Gemmataceae bacterium]|nr:hypothetical protein [Gemmataceae bacterium]